MRYDDHRRPRPAYDLGAGDPPCDLRRECRRCGCDADPENSPGLCAWCALLLRAESVDEALPEWIQDIVEGRLDEARDGIAGLLRVTHAIHPRGAAEAAALVAEAGRYAPDPVAADELHRQLASLLAMLPDLAPLPPGVSWARVVEMAMEAGR